MRAIDEVRECMAGRVERNRADGRGGKLGRDRVEEEEGGRDGV